MSIARPCPLCGSQLLLPETYAGQQIKCPDCSQVIYVPGLAVQECSLPNAPAEHPSPGGCANQACADSPNPGRSACLGAAVGAAVGAVLIPLVCVFIVPRDSTGLHLIWRFWALAAGIPVGALIGALIGALLGLLIAGVANVIHENSRMKQPTSGTAGSQPPATP
jgi:hypothetical protein